MSDSTAKKKSANGIAKLTAKILTKSVNKNKLKLILIDILKSLPKKE